jgi:hypothetical protein
MCPSPLSRGTGKTIPGPVIIPRQGRSPAALPERISGPDPPRTARAARAEAPTRHGPKGGGPLETFSCVTSSHRPHRAREAFARPKATPGGLRWLPDAMPDCSHLSSRCAGTAQSTAVNYAQPRRRASGTAADPTRRGAGSLGQRRGKSSSPKTEDFADSSDRRWDPANLSHLGLLNIKVAPKSPKRLSAHLPGVPLPPGHGRDAARIGELQKRVANPAARLSRGPAADGHGIQK